MTSFFNMAIIKQFWKYSLWLSLPVFIATFTWLISSWQRFNHFETAINQEDNASLATVMTYDATLLLNKLINKSFRAAPHPTAAIRELQLFANESDFKRLQKKLPHSGKRYIKGTLSTADGDFAVRLKYRGSSPLHWRGDKRSLRIRLENKQRWNSLNTFELLVPSHVSLLGSYLASDLAGRLGLITPKTELVWLNVNGESKGLYQLVERITEQTLINHKQMPGDIYGGDVANKDQYLGADNNLFNNAGLWDKLAFNSDYAEQSKVPLQLLVELLAAKQVNFKTLAQVVDYPHFARFYLFNQLVGTPNVDAFHNWRLYFDHSRGRFLPMVWDAEGWREGDSDIELTDLEKQLLADPAFRTTIHKEYLLLQSKGVLERFSRSAQSLIAKLKPWVAYDPYSAIDLNFHNEDDFERAASTLLTRINNTFNAFKLDNQEAPQPKLTAEVWSGKLVFEGVNHVQSPVIIEAGSTLDLAENSVLIFHQKLIMKGTVDKPIKVHAQDPHRPFGAFVIQGSAANGSILDFCEFSGGSHYKNNLINYTAMLSLHEVQAVSISNCTFSNNRYADDMVHAVYSDVTIKDSHFSNATADALDLELSRALIQNSIFSNNNKEAIDIMYSDLVLQSSRLTGNQDSAISIGQKSKTRIENSIIRNNRVAFLVKDDSIMRMTNTEIADNKQIADLKHRNEHYDGGGIAFIYQSQMHNNEKFFAVEKGSVLHIVDSYLSPVFHSNKKRIKIDEYSDDYQKATSKFPLKLHKYDSNVFKSLDEQIPVLLHQTTRGVADVKH